MLPSGIINSVKKHSYSLSTCYVGRRFIIPSINKYKRIRKRFRKNIENSPQNTGGYTDIFLQRVCSIIVYGVMEGGDGAVASSDGGGGDAQESVGDVVDQRRGVRSAPSPAQQGQGLPQHALGEDDQPLPTLQPRQRPRLLQGPSADLLNILSRLITSN